MASIEQTKNRDTRYICSPSSGKEDAGRIPTETTATSSGTSSGTSTTLFAGFSILVLVAMSTISHYYKPTNNNLYEEQQESRLLAPQVEQDEGTTIIPEITRQPKQENRQIEDPATIGIVVIIVTTVAAVSILCNLLLIFLTSRKKEINEESLHPRIYQRIMCSLAVTAIVFEVCFWILIFTSSYDLHLFLLFGLGKLFCNWHQWKHVQCNEAEFAISR